MYVWGPCWPCPAFKVARGADLSLRTRGRRGFVLPHRVQHRWVPDLRPRSPHLVPGPGVWELQTQPPPLCWGRGRRATSTALWHFIPRAPDGDAGCGRLPGALLSAVAMLPERPGIVSYQVRGRGGGALFLSLLSLIPLQLSFHHLPPSQEDRPLFLD